MRVVLLLLLLALGLVAATNHTGGLPSVINISFVKEVTLSVQPPDFVELVQDGNQQQVESFLSSSLRLLDPTGCTGHSSGSAACPACRESLDCTP
jgi:hypothetical protein